MTLIEGLIVGAVVIVFMKLGYFVWLALRHPEPVSADEVHTVMTEDCWPIRLFRHKPKGGQGEPVFMCHALATNHLNYELPHGHSLADALSAAGYDCWLIDLRGNRNSPAPKGRSRREAGVDDYLFKDVPAAIAYIREHTGYERVHWVGHSMGGMLMYAYEATFGREHLASAVTFGSPIGFGGTSLANHWYAVWLASRAPWILSAVIRGGTPFARIFKPQIPGMPINWENMHEKIGTTAYYNLLEAPPGGVADDMNRWAHKREWRMHNRNLDMTAAVRKIETPLLAFYAKSDPFVSLKDAEALFEALPNPDKRMIVLSKANGCANDYNHCDIVFAPAADREVFAHVIEWLEAHPADAQPAVVRRSARVESAARNAASILGLAAADLLAPATPAVKRKAASTKSAAKPKTSPAKKKSAAKKTAATSPAKSAAKPKAKPSAKKKVASSATKPKVAVKKKAATNSVKPKSTAVSKAAKKAPTKKAAAKLGVKKKSN